jgi:hypothetical protein
LHSFRAGSVMIGAGAMSCFMLDRYPSRMRWQKTMRCSPHASERAQRQDGKRDSTRKRSAQAALAASLGFTRSRNSLEGLK